MKIGVSDYLYELDADGETIHYSGPEGRLGSFRSPQELGKILDLAVYGMRLLIIREFGFELFKASLDPMRCTLKTLARFDKKIINLRQVKYRLGEIKRRKPTNGNAVK